MASPSLGFISTSDKRQMWKDIAKDSGGEFRLSHDAGHVIETHLLSIPHKNWKLEISISDSRPLKFYIAYNPKADFEFTLGQNDLIERIINKLGRKPIISMGWNEFDKQYILISRQGDLIKKIVSKDVQKLLLRHRVHAISFHSDRNKEKAELVSVIQRNAGNRDMIMDLIGVFRQISDNLALARVIN